MHAHIVVDLGFGDAGKGLITDFLVRKNYAGLVVRYNGGAQAGHNVVAPDGRHHTFSQFGSGTFVPGVRTFLTKEVIIHPGALLVEGDVLISKGVTDAFSRLRVSEGALVITPFHQAANRIHELMRGNDRHGSCGVGVGETYEDTQSHPGETIKAGDLGNKALLLKKLRAVHERKREQLVARYSEKALEVGAQQEWQIFTLRDLAEDWITSISRINELGLVTPDSALEQQLKQTEHVVFEGAQGILLDAEIGFHPYTSWTRSTAQHALDVITEMAPGSTMTQIGVTRCYMVRHGPGPLPTETDQLAPLVAEHNRRNGWQGGVRYGWFDSILSRYALQQSGTLDTLAVTHLDILPKLREWKYCVGYENPNLATEILEANSGSLEERVRITQELIEAEPIYEACDAKEEVVIAKLEEFAGKPVQLASCGPCSVDVKLL